MVIIEMSVNRWSTYSIYISILVQFVTRPENVMDSCLESLLEREGEPVKAETFPYKIQPNCP